MLGTLELAQELISRRSLTPDDGGCQDLLASRLSAAGFQCEFITCGSVSNLWARRGNARPLLCFAGHTDVVPTGPLAEWLSDPFTPTLRDGRLYGRGAADMKSSIAAFVVAVEAFARERPTHEGSIALLLTSDEEGPSVDGTVRVVERLKARGETLDYCIVGEPSSAKTLGDTVRVGRRGSLSARLTIRGVQGHVAYPEQVKNPLHLLAPALAEIVATSWDAGNEFFPPTSFQVSNLNAGTGAENVVPGSVEILCNFRFSTASSETSLKERFAAVLRKHKLDYSLAWTLGGKPFLSKPGKLTAAVQRSVQAQTGLLPELSTAGGTSDGRFLIDICPEIVELGPVNASIHKLNEHIELAAFETLPRIYLDILRSLLP
ncbi:MAG: succinyl-diaminopimelate desuccinylase [Betaproteobacteria bacterium]|nr:succinyl-diaminopimelate desuccinylase [Betaproteobacteria bacterium]MSQ87955.1 succinyl-diaminopimelate desuccinylase [Betaproteobacteria bacterium]